MGMGDFKGAIPHLQKAVETFERARQEPDSTYVSLHRQLTTCCLQTDDFPMALAYAQRALDVAGQLEESSDTLSARAACEESMDSVLSFLGRTPRRLRGTRLPW